MPAHVRVPCKHPGCAALIPYGSKYCEAHRLCEECLKEGRYVKATVVDHVVPHRGDPTLFWDRSNWRGLCKSCHDKKTGREDSHPTYHY